MPTLNIGGRRITVGDDFLKLSPEDQNSTVEEIARSLPRVATTVEAPTEAAPGAPVTAEGLYNAADIGLQTGVAGLASLPRTVGTLGAQGIQYLQNRAVEATGLPESYKDMRDLSQDGLVKLPTQESALATIQSEFGGKPYTPQNVPEEYMSTLGEFAPNVIMGALGIMRGVVAPAVLSETAGQLTKGTEAEPYARLAGALAGGAGGARSAEKAAAKALPKAKEADDLAAKLYKINEEATAGVPVSGVHEFVKGAKNLLSQSGARKINSHKAYELLDTLPGDVKDGYDLVKAREVFRKELNAAGETRAANLLTKAFDEAIDNVSEKGVSVLQAADREYSIARTLDALNKRFKHVENTTASANSGKNLGNKYRQNLSSLANNEAATRGLKPDELAQVERTIQGSALENALRNYSNRLGGGGGLGQTLLGVGGAGASYGMGLDPQTSAALGFGLGASGSAARAMANRLTARQANKLREMVAARSALAEGIRRPSGLSLGAPVAGAALLAALRAQRDQQ